MSNTGNWMGLLRSQVTARIHRRELWALSDQAVVSGSNFLTNIMLARFIGLHEFGIFALCWMTVLFVNSIQYALVVQPTMSIGPKQQEKDRPSYYGAVFFQELILVCVCFAVVYAGLHVFTDVTRYSGLRPLALPLAVSAFAYQAQDFVRRYFFAAGKSRLALLDDLLSYLTQLPILFLLHITGRLNSATALWVMAGTSLLGLCVGWLWVEPLAFEWTRVKEVFSRHWRIARWLGASALLQWTSGNLFIIAAPIYYGASAAGVLRAAQNLMGVTHVWFQGLDNVVPAEASRRLHEGGTKSMLSFLRSVLLKWGGLTLAFALLMSATPGHWMGLVYGAQMAPYGYVLRLYALIYVIVFIGGPLRAGLQALEFTAPIFWSYLCMTLFSVTLAVPMAKWLGLYGVMLGILGTQIVFQSIVGCTLLRRSRIGLSPHL